MRTGIALERLCERQPEQRRHGETQERHGESADHLVHAHAPEEPSGQGKPLRPSQVSGNPYVVHIDVHALEGHDEEHEDPELESQPPRVAESPASVVHEEEARKKSEDESGMFEYEKESRASWEAALPRRVQEPTPRKANCLVQDSRSDPHGGAHDVNEAQQCV